MTDEIIPTFTETWLEEKLADIFTMAVNEAKVANEWASHRDSEMVEAYAAVLELFTYNGMNRDQIEDAIWETAHTDQSVVLFDQDCYV